MAVPNEEKDFYISLCKFQQIYEDCTWQVARLMSDNDTAFSLIQKTTIISLVLQSQQATAITKRLEL